MVFDNAWKVVLGENPSLVFEVLEEDGSVGVIDLLDISPDPTLLLSYPPRTDRVEKGTTIGTLSTENIEYYHDEEKVSEQEALEHVEGFLNESIRSALGKSE